MTSKLKLIFRL